jgi:hypothetical protein
LPLIILGKPDNAQIGIRNKHDPLPQSIDGLLMSMLNHAAKKARLTFKLEFDELWINTGRKHHRTANNSIDSLRSLYLSAETTKKIPMPHIRNIIDEPIEGHEGYSIVGFQTGTTYV